MNNKTMSGATGPYTSSKPVPMKLFATWEVDRTPSDCIPRLCSLTLTRLVVLRPLGNDLASISIAVKMQSNKRTLRSNELLLPPNGLLDTSLELTFSLQYPHFLKQRDGNRLHVLLQRRRRYKNRTMLGFKTLAEGVIRMDQVLQKQMDLELELSSENSNKDNKGAIGPMAKINVLGVSSTPVDGDHKPERDRGECSEEEDEFSSGEEEAADLSDSEPTIRTSKLPHTRHNLKQRFVSLLKRFKVAEGSEGVRGASLANTTDIQALFQELESLSCDEDSGGEPDTMSISSTPKPSLRPFFSSSRSLLDSNLPGGGGGADTDEKNCSGGSDGNADLCGIGTDYEAQSDPQTTGTGSPPREKNVARLKSDPDNSVSLLLPSEEKKTKLFRTSVSTGGKKKHSLSIGGEATPVVIATTPETVVARKTFLENVTRVLPLDENLLPDHIVLIAGIEQLVNALTPRLHLQFQRILNPVSAAEVRAVMTTLFAKIHKYCNSYAKPSTPIKVILIGGDSLVGWMLRPYVELLSNKTPDWIGHIRLYIAPLGQASLVSRQLASLDAGYMSLFPPDQDIKDELGTRVARYVSGNGPVTQLSLAEAMLTFQDDSSQLFIPFVSEVRVGPADSGHSLSVDLEDLMCLSPPALPQLTPPSSPNVQVRETPWEPLELQLDYWQLPGAAKTSDNKGAKPDGKTSLRGLLRGLQASPGLNLAIHMASKEKKQKIMRLGKKKDKDATEARSHSVDSISRLICSAKGSNASPMRIIIDGSEWTGVKFFQLSNTWQTHVKYLSVALVGVPLASADP